MAQSGRILANAFTLSFAFCALVVHASFPVSPGSSGELMGDVAAQWIYASEQTPGLVTFTKTFTNQYQQLATIYALAEDRVDVFLNNNYIVTIYHSSLAEPCTTWQQGSSNKPYTSCEGAVPVLVPAGTHTLTLRVATFSVGRPKGIAGIVASLRNSFTRVTLVRTDPSWTYSPVGPVDTIGERPVQQPVYTQTRGDVNFSRLDKDALFIWATNDFRMGAPIGATYTFAKTFNVAAAQTATLRLAADDSCDIYLNGAYVASYGWLKGGNIQSLPGLSLRVGSNLLALRCMNAPQSATSFFFCCLGDRRGNPAYLVGSLLGADGRTVLARTDASWQVTSIAGSP